MLTDKLTDIGLQGAPVYAARQSFGTSAGLVMDWSGRYFDVEAVLQCAVDHSEPDFCSCSCKKPSTFLHWNKRSQIFGEYPLLCCQTVAYPETYDAQNLLIFSTRALERPVRNSIRTERSAF